MELQRERLDPIHQLYTQHLVDSLNQAKKVQPDGEADRRAQRSRQDEPEDDASAERAARVRRELRRDRRLPDLLPLGPVGTRPLCALLLLGVVPYFFTARVEEEY